MARSSSRSIRRARRRRVSPARQISRILFTAYAGTLLLWPVYLSSGTPRIFAVCEIGAPLQFWLDTAFDWPISIYGLLTTVGAGMFLRPKILQAAILSGLVAVGVEVLEATLNTGACRARDLLPAAIGIAMAVSVHTAMFAATPARQVRVRRMKGSARAAAKRKWIML